ncbi:hypothetical protein KBB96_11295 [Luteolibacter ambystomatis]|uniref:Uncharacterized protein n=1 Tax=Luteolibacter ambystomatis TaxID=2824561 RepID=A0A975G5Q9_9BACT|nr:hypothetical protein [Luteolibacter ambystomatis]QUE49458.1 hypothetical protein KBB96_11295 [Luteolibacter ambystomatis]
MRLRFQIVALFLAAGTMARGQDQDLLRQIQVVNGQTVIYDTPLTSTDGTIMSQPITNNTVFQLYSQVYIPPSGGLGLFLGTTVLDLGLQLSLSLFGKASSLSFVKVDETTLGTYLPSVTIQALSEDSSVPARTRADRPYGMRIQVSGLQSDPTVPEYARKMQVRRSYKTYDPLIYAYTAASASGEYTDATTLQQNGTFVDNAILQRLPTSTPTKATGQETFTVYTHPDAGGVQTQYAAATVQIWPVATSQITGIDTTRTYQAPPTTGSVQLSDAYPKSVTYVQVYKGNPALGTTGTPLGATVVSYDSTVPQNAMLAITGLEDVAKEDGTYTLEVLTITPFNSGAPERLAYTTFKLDRTIQVNASMNTFGD